LRKIIEVMYPAELVLPMKAELTERGFEDLSTPELVDAAMTKEGTTLLVLNSVCGCSAGTARPGVVMAVQQAAKKPDHLVTSFAGFDTAAVAQARTYLLPYPPSSPCIALLKNGELVHMIERHMIEGRPAQMIAANLQDAFNQHCN
jgi:putative YphP/YqiW family bacilliredoxin